MEQLLGLTRLVVETGIAPAGRASEIFSLQGDHRDRNQAGEPSNMEAQVCCSPMACD